MKRTALILAAGFVASLLAANAAPRAEGIRGRELLGVRVGGVVSGGAFNDKFGSGSEIDIHFIHGLTGRFGIAASLASHNFGESLDREKNAEFFGRLDMNFQIFSVSAAAVFLEPLSQKLTATFEGGPGLYSANAILPEGFYEAQKTDNHFGLYAGAGLLYRVGSTFYVNANVKYHNVFIGTGVNDTIHFYTGENQVRFFQIAVGVMIAAG
jgi:hypothetical protein